MNKQEIIEWNNKEITRWLEGLFKKYGDNDNDNDNVVIKLKTEQLEFDFTNGHQ